MATLRIRGSRARISLNAFLWDIALPPSHAHFPLSTLIPLRSRRLLILPQPRQNLPKPLLPRPTRPTLHALPAQIHQLGNPLPAGAAGGGVFAGGEEVCGFFAGSRDGLVFFGVVVLVEVVDVGLGRFDRFGFFGGGDFGAAGEVGVAAGAPLSVRVGRVSIREAERWG